LASDLKRFYDTPSNSYTFTWDGNISTLYGLQKVSICIGSGPEIMSNPKSDVVEISIGDIIAENCCLFI
jgi:hypothetical protein